MQKADRWLGWAAAIFIGTYFWRLVRPTLHVFFTPDDLMNLHRSWFPPASRLVRDNLLFFLASPFQRPFGAVWYRVVYFFAGFRPEPFHAALLALLYVNIWLTYALTRRLTGSRTAALAAALIGCYYHRLGSLYFDTGFIYDVLCYLFTLAALVFYIRVRQSGRFLRARDLAVFAVLFILALNSKEMALTLPGLLGIYELLYHRPEPLRKVAWGQAAPIVLAAVLAIAFVAGHLTGPDTLIHNDAYTPHFTWTQFLLTSRHYLGDLHRSGEMVTSAQTLGLWAALVIIAAVARSRALLFACAVILLTPLPIAFLFPRGPAQYYIPFYGLVLYAATVIDAAAQWLTRRWRNDGYWFARVRCAVLLAGLAALLYPWYKRIGWEFVSSASVEAPVNAYTARELHALYPSLPHNSKLFFLHDPLIPGSWNMYFLTQLSYGDRTLVVDAASRTGRPTDEALATCDHVFDYAGGRFFELQRPWIRPLTPMIEMTYRGPEFFHLDWSPVTPRKPAAPGEKIIAKVADLGATDPPVPDERPFPDAPLLTVARAVEVSIGGKRAPVELEIGWPGAINAYRVDFHVPDNAASGAQPVQISSGGASGPASELAIAGRKISR